MSAVPSELKYTKEHEWLKVEGTTVTVGITDFAQSSLGDIVFVDLPDAGTEFESGDSLGAIESVKAAEDLYTPISGKVIESNAALADNWAVVNSDCYGAGWLVKIEISDTAQLDELMDADAYNKLLEELND